jgi:hypothetical protein
MITPSPTTKLDPRLARGTLAAINPASGPHPAHIVLAIPNTSYEIALVPTAPISTPPGHRLLGTIRATSRRIDLVETGGRYIEPVFGKPRRIQGTVLGSDPSGALIVNATVPFLITPGDPRQSASMFPEGSLIALDLPDWPTFTPA